ncbi:DNA-3-methyladenine glycosylase I [Thermococcus pacificus]|uniref:Uncharacterized protein n=1 Tax=Thermococcus pacificus TaxID=71998 RepID=A0A218P9C4_9EURY|nr:DNA-3-methyladenine glycosylase I [Thermococcus pacificus]ASJ07386.1 hypothetical protein A3L08_08675 [Thermococcus pacificus]
MGVTAFIVVGNRPGFTPGIPNPGYLLLLYENDRPAWELIPLYPELRKDLGNSKILIPSIENMLEDALLMIGIYVVKDEELIEKARRIFRDSLERRIEIYAFDRREVEDLRSIARRKLQRYDIGLIIAPGEDSTILGQLEVLREYGDLWYQVNLPDKKLSNTPGFFDEIPLQEHSDSPRWEYTEAFWKILNKLEEKSIDKKKFRRGIEDFNSYRERFRKMSDDEIYSTLVQVVFYSGMNAKTVSKKMPTILKYLGDFRKVAEYTEEDIRRIMDDRDMIKNLKKIQACIHNAKEFQRIVESHGSFVNYLESFEVDPTNYRDIKTKLVPELMKRFKGIGKVTVYHFLMDLGFGVMKPDRTILRLFHRLGWLPTSDPTAENIERTIKICSEISSETGFWIRAVDITLVAFCQEGGNQGLGIPAGICTRNPKCLECPLRERCVLHK